MANKNMLIKISKEAAVKGTKKLSVVNGAKFIALKPMEVKGQQTLKISASNVSMQVETYIACQCEKPETMGTIFVSASFLNIIRAIISDNLIIELNEKNLTLKSADFKTDIELPFLENCSLLVADILEMEDAQEHPTQKDFLYQSSINGLVLTNALKVFGCMTDTAKNQTFASFICLELDEQCLGITSTNGNAFCHGAIPHLSLTKGTADVCRTTIPVEVEKTLEACEIQENVNVTMTVQDQLLFINWKSNILYFRLSNITFPEIPVEKMFGLPAECKCCVDRAELENSIRLVDLATPEKEKSNGVTSIELFFTGEGLQLQSSSSNVKIQATDIEGEGGKTCLSGKYLSQLMGILPPRVVVEKKNEAGKGAVLLNGFAYIMPISKAK